MSASVTFFPVGNGDMTLVRLGDPRETRILVDCNIRNAADDASSTTRDVAKDLRARLPKDGKGRPYVHVFALSHPDQDHCSGLRRHFHLGPIENYADDDLDDAEKRIVIHELWSSPMVFRRACKSHTLCEDAKAFNAEARRRVRVNRAKSFAGVGDGDRILVLGEDQDGKTDDLDAILVRTDETFNRVNGETNVYLSAHLLAPRPPQEEDLEDALSKNHSSVVLNLHLAVDPGDTTACRFLTGGDAEVLIWERLWERYKDTPEVLAYDMLQTPHHCSWHSLSWDSWSDCGAGAEVSATARHALGQAKTGAFVIGSCNPIEDDDQDPPCIRAKIEYDEIVAGVSGKFYCTGEHPSRRFPEPLEFRVTRYGPSLLKAASTSAAIVTSQRAG